MKIISTQRTLGSSNYLRNTVCHFLLACLSRTNSRSQQAACFRAIADVFLCLPVPMRIADTSRFLIIQDHIYFTQHASWSVPSRALKRWFPTPNIGSVKDKPERRILRVTRTGSAENPMLNREVKLHDVVGVWCAMNASMITRVISCSRTIN